MWVQSGTKRERRQMTIEEAKQLKDKYSNPDISDIPSALADPRVRDVLENFIAESPLNLFYAYDRGQIIAAWIGFASDLETGRILMDHFRKQSKETN